MKTLWSGYISIQFHPKAYLHKIEIGYSLNLWPQNSYFKISKAATYSALQLHQTNLDNAMPLMIGK